MAYQYSVSVGPAATGPWTLFNQVAVTTDTVTGLASGTTYFFQIIVTDQVTGVVSSPIVAGPFTTTAVAAESTNGTAVTAASQTILSSQTPGQAAPASGPFDTWSITAANGQIVHNGTTDSNSGNIIELYYLNHFVYQEANAQNELGITPGWWQFTGGTTGNGFGWTAVQDPRPVTPTISLGTISAQLTTVAFGISGTLQNYTTAPTLQYEDNTGAFVALPTGSTVSTTAFSFTHPGVSSATASMTVSVRDANATTVSATSNSFTVSAPGQVTLTGISLSSTSVVSGTSGAVVGAISVQTTGGPFGGGLSLSSGTTNFKINGTSLVTTQSLAVNTSPGYPVTIVATMTGATGSPLSQAFNITAVAVAANSITINLKAPTGNSLSPHLFGSSMASDVDFLGGGGSSESGGWSSTATQQAAKNTAGFGLPGMYARCNTNETSFNSDGSPNLTYVDRVSSFLPNIIDITKGVFVYSLGVAGSGDGFGGVGTAVYAASAVACAKEFVAKGCPVRHWEVGNEPNGRADLTTYCNYFNATADALHNYATSINDKYFVIGPVPDDGGNAGTWLNTFGKSCGAKADYVSYHAYFGDATSFGGKASSVRSALSGTAGANLPTSFGEYNQNSNPPGNQSQQTMSGVMSNVGGLYYAFTTDPLTQYGAIWDWLGDGYYGLIIDPNNNPSGLPSNSVIPVGYALKNCRQYIGGNVVSTTVAGSLTSGSNNVVCLTTVNGTQFGVWVINFGATVAINFSGLSTATGITYTEVSNANLTSVTKTLSNSNLANLSIPGTSVVTISGSFT